MQTTCSLSPGPRLQLQPLGREPQTKAFGGFPAGLRWTLLMSVVLSPNSFLINMGDSSVEAGATASDTVAEEVSLFSKTDMIMFSLIVGFLTYWFLFRKKKDEVPEFTKIQTT